MTERRNVVRRGQLRAETGPLGLAVWRSGQKRAFTGKQFGKARVEWGKRRAERQQRPLSRKLQ